MCGLYSVVKAMVNDNSEIRNKRLKYYNYQKIDSYDRRYQIRYHYLVFL